VPDTRPTETLGSKITYGLGAIAYGVKDSGFAYFLLLFYSQVLGVPATLAGLAIFISLLFDALSDPFVGYLSDNLHSRWGRRHPLMYASALPVAVCFYLLFNPPQQLQGAELFPYMLGMAIMLRLAITFYEVPSSALVAELTQDYHQRTNFLSFRVAVGWWGGLTLSVVTLTVLLSAADGSPGSGYFDVAGYGKMGLLGAVLIFASIMVCALGTHRHIPLLQPPPQRQAFSLARARSELVETLARRSFFALFGATIMFGTASGVTASMFHYMNNFFWELSTNQAGLLSASAFISALFAFVLTPWVSRRMGKRRAVLVFGTIAFTCLPLPIFLRILGLFPENGTELLFHTLLLWNIFEVTLIITTQVLGGSMLADLVEEAELDTGRRSEGVFFAASTFTRKLVTGLGLMLASGILALIELPTQAQAAAVDPAIITRLGLLFAPSLLVLNLAGVAALAFYRIDQQTHEDNVSRIAAANKP